MILTDAELKSIVLTYLLRWAMEQDQSDVGMETLCQNFAVKLQDDEQYRGIPPAQLRKAIQSLVKEKQVEVFAGTKSDRIVLTEAGRVNTVNEIRTGKTLANSYFQNPKKLVQDYGHFVFRLDQKSNRAIEPFTRENLISGTWPSEESETLDQITGKIPASDRIVTLDHNSSTYTDAIAALDAALQAFKADNRFGNEWAAEKSALTKTIEAGRALLNEVSIQASVAWKLTIEPIREIVEKYRNAAIFIGAIVGGDVFTRAIDLLSKLLS